MSQTNLLPLDDDASLAPAAGSLAPLESQAAGNGVCMT